MGLHRACLYGAIAHEFLCPDRFGKSLSLYFEQPYNIGSHFHFLHLLVPGQDCYPGEFSVKLLTRPTPTRRTNMQHTFPLLPGTTLARIDEFVYSRKCTNSFSSRTTMGNGRDVVVSRVFSLVPPWSNKMLIDK